VTRERLLELLRERAPWFDAEVGEIRWSLVVRFEARLASRFGRGRAWLAGDSGHVTGPVGVQSMNVGLREGADLAERLAAIRGGGSAELLEEYGRERTAEWRALLGFDGPPAARAGTDPWVAQNAARILPCLPASGEALRELAGRLGLDLPAS
jgi:2-polyprenyl-6-methoxyphenol hydroxylase-like FAD-dependent oxidoreductase